MSEESDKKFHKLTCANCRKKKAGCDGAYPFCMNCKNSKKKCIYDKPASIAYVRHLEKQVEQLERQLKSYDESGEIVIPMESPQSQDSHLGNSSYRRMRDPNEGLEFNIDHLTLLMTDLEIQSVIPTNSNVTAVPFSYVANTLSFKHYFDGDLNKQAPEYFHSGLRLNKLIDSIRQKYTGKDGEGLFPDRVLIRENVLLGAIMAAQGFPYFRPNYVNRYYRDFHALLATVMNFINVDKPERKDKYGFDSLEMVETFSSAGRAFYRIIVSPYLEKSSDEERQESEEEYTQKTRDLQAKTLEMIGQNLFAPINPSIVQACLHASMTEVMLGGSLSSAVLLNNISSRLAIELFEHYTLSLDSLSTLWFLRILWSCYIWDKIISSCCNKNPTFPKPPPLSPSEMEFNAMDIFATVGADGTLKEIDARPAIIATCRLSIVLSDVLLRHHHFTTVRVHLMDVVDKITSSLPDELTPRFDLAWDTPLDLENPLKVIKLPENYPVEFMLPIAMTIVIKLELYCESFVNLTESRYQTKSNKNVLENEYVVFQNMIEMMKLAVTFAKLVSERGPYKDIATAASYINPWYRLQVMKSLYKVLINDESVKLLVLLTEETPSDEILSLDVKLKYDFVDNPENIALDIPESAADDSLPAEQFIKNLTFHFNGSSNFKEGTKDRTFYLKLMISIFIAVAQLSVHRLAEFKSALSQEVLAQSLITRTTALEVFSDQRAKVVTSVSLLPNPKFDGDLDDSYDFEKLMDMIKKLGKLSNTLLRKKKEIPIAVGSPASINNSPDTQSVTEQSFSLSPSSKPTLTTTPTSFGPVNNKGRGSKRQGVSSASTSTVPTNEPDFNPQQQQQQQLHLQLHLHLLQQQQQQFIPLQNPPPTWTPEIPVHHQEPYFYQPDPAAGQIPPQHMQHAMMQQQMMMQLQLQHAMMFPNGAIPQGLPTSEGDALIYAQMHMPISMGPSQQQQGRDVDDQMPFMQMMQQQQQQQQQPQQMPPQMPPIPLQFASMMSMFGGANMENGIAGSFAGFDLSMMSQMSNADLVTMLSFDPSTINNNFMNQPNDEQFQ